MTANTEQRDHWNADEAHHWVEYEDVHDTMLEPFGRALLDAANLRPGESVLDAGCGTGWTSLDAGQRVGPDGAVRGVDLSVPRCSGELASERLRRDSSTCASTSPTRSAGLGARAYTLIAS